jgi:hypothetical protein
MGVSRLQKTGDYTVSLPFSTVAGVLCLPLYVTAPTSLPGADEQLMILVDPCLRNVSVVMTDVSGVLTCRVQKQHGLVGRSSAAKRYFQNSR